VADVFRQACAGGAAIEPGHRFEAAIDAYLVDGDAPSLVKGYLPATPEAVRIRRSIAIALRSAPLWTPPRWRRSRRIREASWRDAWKKHFGVQSISRSLVVKPSWVTYRLKEGQTVIEIDPGMAFGTGQHPTTAMCLRAIEEWLRPGMRVMDLGSGSGILSIAAARLGASRVLALDLDPLAVKAAQENAVRNGVPHLIEAREGTVGAAGPVRAGQADLVVANISSLTLERLAPALAGSLAPRGILIASGFLDDAVRALSAAFEAEALQVEQVTEEGVWRAIIAAKTR